MFPLNTLIRSDLKGNLIPIQNIRPGISLPTHTRRMREVRSIINEQYDGTSLTITVTGYQIPIETTPEQLFLVYPNLKLLNGVPETDPTNLQADRSFDIAWKRADGLTTNDYIQLPSPYKPPHVQMHNLKGGQLPDGAGLYAKIGAIASKPFRGFMYNVIVDTDNSMIAKGYTVRL